MEIFPEAFFRFSIHLSVIFPGLSYRQMYRKFKKAVLGLLVHVTPSIFFSTMLRREALVYKSYFVRTAILWKLFNIRFSYKHCNFSRVCLLVKMASKTVIRSRPVTRILCGGVLTRPKRTKLPKCIFYCLIRLFRKVAIHEKL